MITMEKVPLRTSRWTLVLAMLALMSPSATDATELRSNNPLNPPAPIYWCPKRTPDQQYSTTQAPGCTPLVSEADKQRAAEREKEGKLQAKTPIKIQNIQTLRIRLEQLGESKDTLEALEYEPAARERRRIQQEKDAITKELRPVRPPDSARTGMEVEDTTLPNRFGTTIQDTTLPNSFGA